MFETSTGAETLFPSMPKLRWQSWRFHTSFTVALMDLSWVVAWLGFLLRYTQEVLWLKSLLGLLTLLIVAFTLSNVIHRFRVNLRTRRFVLGIFFIFSYLGLLQLLMYAERGQPLNRIFLNMHDSFLNPSMPFPAEIGVLALSAFLWIRGVVLSMAWIGTHTVMRALRVGIFVFLWLGILWPNELARLGYFALCFLISSVIAHTFARANTLSLVRGGRTRSFNVHWLLVVQLIAIICIGSSMLAGGHLYIELGFVMLVILRMFLILVFFLTLGLLSPLIFVVMIIFPSLFQGLTEVPILEEMIAILRQVFGRITGFVAEVGGLVDGLVVSTPLIQRLFAYAIWLIVLGVILGVSIWLGRKNTKRFPSSISVRVDEHRDTLSPTYSSIRRKLKMHLAKWGLWFNRLQSGQIWFGATRIRAIYSHLMELCDQLGAGRREVETPSEFLRTLRHLFPHDYREIALITDAYIRVRYGEFPETREEVKQVEEAWRTLKTQGKDLKIAQASRTASRV